MRAFLVVVFYIVAVRSLASPASLVLEMDKDIYRVGELGVITLRIDGATIDPLPAKQPGVASATEVTLFSAIPADTGFTYRTRWRAPGAGLHTIGPFTLTIDGKELKSGAKQVLVKNDETSGIEVSFDRMEATVGTSFHIEIRTTGRELDGIWLQAPDLVTVSPVTSTTTRTFSAGRRTTLNIYKFPIKAAKTGTLEITPDHFQGIEPAIQFPPIKIEIHAGQAR